ncbi:membrane protein insertase YidC [Candidatus Dependentiae bacterium]|nr:membrane protein insertase YidC [Candidatus Dependentiae bacterium]MBU4387565.1 membrane protein insertase YidC [Candidatus Dependentiae bacterium]MCG2756640.1 membrane protein insertase YidC [Candidatus Dependentiae bacterium]
MDKKLVYVLLSSLAAVWIFNYFSPKKESLNLQDIKPGQGYNVPSASELAKPINLEIDFLDKKITEKESFNEIETDLLKVSFSNYGGVLSGVEFKKHLGKNSQPLKIIQNKGFYEREQGAFLVALDEKTPYFYKFEGSFVDGDKTNIVYSTNSSGWLIRKVYSIYNNNYKIDLKLDFEKSSDASLIRPRLFFPSPMIGEIEKDLQSVVIGSLDNKSVDKIAEKDLTKAWVKPEIIGSQDKYFLMTLFADNNEFVNRAFFKKTNNQIFTILEGKELSENYSTKLSFYIGPKLVEDLIVVDKRLEDVLDFGWLSWFCKLMLKLLQYLYSLVGNFGVAIILMSIILKLPFVPLSISSRKKLEEYQKHTPAINKIRQKYKGNPELLNQELMKYHKDHDISLSTQFVGCLPLLLQMPILFSLYRVLGNYIELYQAPFAGWITNLSAADPFYVLPVLMGISTFVQQAMTPVKDASQKVMLFVMPIFLTIIFFNFPAGLVLYWLMNNLLTIIEDLFRKKYFR